MNKNRFFWALSAVLVLGILFILNDKEQKVKILPSFQTSSMTELHLTHKENNKIKWELSAENALFPFESKEIVMKSINLKFSHSPDIYLTSGGGKYEFDRNYVIFDQSVKLTMKDIRFETERLKWRGADELITTEDTIMINGNDFTIEGKGLTADINNEKATIRKNVKALFFH